MILITGHRGFIGKRLFQKVKALGIDLQDGLNLLTCPLPENITCIYHLAAQSSVEASWFDPLHDLDNLRITARLVHAYPYTKFIYANSAAAIPPLNSPYGFSKWASGEYIRKFHHNYVTTTFPNIYGEGSKSVVDIFKKTDHVTIFGDGLQTRDYVHVDDIVEGLLKARHWANGEYQMGSGIATSVMDLAEGKNVTFLPARLEARESVLRNDTPDWSPIIKINEYL